MHRNAQKRKDKRIELKKKEKKAEEKKKRKWKNNNKKCISLSLDDGKFSRPLPQFPVLITFTSYLHAHDPRAPERVASRGSGFFFFFNEHSSILYLSVRSYRLFYRERKRRRGKYEIAKTTRQRSNERTETKRYSFDVLVIVLRQSTSLINIF